MCLDHAVTSLSHGTLGARAVLTYPLDLKFHEHIGPMQNKRARRLEVTGLQRII